MNNIDTKTPSIVTTKADNIDMKASSAFTTSSSGLPVYRVQYVNSETEEPVSDVDIITGADCVKYINENPIIKENLGFKKGEHVNSDMKEIVDGLLYPYAPPEFVSIENTSALQDFDTFITKDYYIIKEKGTSIKKFNLAVTVMAGSNIMVRCSLIRIQNNIREAIENKQLKVESGDSVTLDFNIPGFTNDIQYFFEISDNENNVESVKITFEFALPIYVGYAKDGLLDPEMKSEDISKYLDSLISQSNKVEKRLTMLNSTQKAFFNVVDTEEALCPFILVPLKWNSIVKIEDVNGLDITKFYGNNNYILLDTHENNTDYEGYVIYISKQPVDCKYKTKYLREISYNFSHDSTWKDSKTEGEQTEILTGFDVLTNGPIDSRFVVNSYNDLPFIDKPYEGLVVYIKNIQTYYKYNAYGAWEVTNNMTRFYSGKPSDTMGGKMDISIDIATGDIYQKNNSNMWELKGNMRTGVANNE